MNITIENFEHVFGITYEQALIFIKEHNVDRRYYSACCMAQALEAQKYLEDNFGVQKSSKEILESGNSFVFTTPSYTKKIVIK